jgi:hypothetical protein
VRLCGGVGVMLIMIDWREIYQSKGQGLTVKYIPMCLNAPFPECAC